MKPSGQCYALLVQLEGCRLEAYQCDANEWTIGYGHTGPDVYEGLTITNNRALALLKSDVLVAASVVDNAVRKRLSQHEYDALVSFVFNVGVNAFRDSTMLKLINDNADSEVIARQFNRWILVKGKVNQGLINRREIEKRMFLEGK